MKPITVLLILGVLIAGAFLYLIRDLYLPGEPRVTIPPEPVACTLDAKLCPDGSAVGRVPPSCEFAPCPAPIDAGGFAACAAAGNPIMESYPRQCRWPNGTSVPEATA